MIFSAASRRVRAGAFLYLVKSAEMLYEPNVADAVLSSIDFY